MAILERATEFPDGISFGSTLITEGELDPSVNEEIAPKGSLYLRTNGEIWKKYGDSNSQWRQLSLDDLIHDPTGFVNRTDSVISFDNPTLTLTVQPTTDSFIFYSNGQKYIKTSSVSSTIDDTTGVWFVYFDSDGELTTSQTFWDLEVAVPVCTLYWNSSDGSAYILSEERHGLVMSWRTHEYLHLTRGTQIESGGFTLGNYTLSGDGTDDSDAQVSFTDGIIWNEDIDIHIEDSPSPSGSFQQILDPVAKIPVCYMTGNAEWHIDTATDYACKQGTSRLQWNKYSGGSWSVEDVSNDDHFVAMWVYATTSFSEPIIAVLGRHDDASLLEALENNTVAELYDGTLPWLEYKLLYRLIFKTSSSYANTPSAVLVDIGDVRSQEKGEEEAPITTNLEFTGSPTSNTLLNLIGWYRLVDSAASFTSATPVTPSIPGYGSQYVLDVSSAVGLPFTVRFTGTSVEVGTNNETTGDTEDLSITSDGYYKTTKTWVTAPSVSIVEASKSFSADVYRVSSWNNSGHNFTIDGVLLEWVPDVTSWFVKPLVYKISSNGEKIIIDDTKLANTDTPPRTTRDEPGKYSRYDYASFIDSENGEGIILEFDQRGLFTYHIQLYYHQ